MTTYTLSDSVAFDGSVDVTADIESFLSGTVVDGSGVGSENTVAFHAGGIYRVDGIINVDDRNHLIFDGGASGATFQTADLGSAGVARSMWHCNIGSNLTFRRFTINGPYLDDGWDADFEAQHGIRLDGVNGALVENIVVNDVRGDFVHIQRSNSPGQTDSANNIVRLVTGDTCGRQGISITNGTGHRVSACNITGIARSAFDLEPSGTNTMSDVIVRNNTIGTYGNFPFAHAGSSADVHDITFEGNVCTVDNQSAAQVAVHSPTGAGPNRYNLTIRNNYFAVGNNDNGGGAVRIAARGYDNVLIIGNRFKHMGGATTMPGVLLEDATNVSSNVQVRCNIFDGYDSLWLSESSAELVQKNNTLTATRPAGCRKSRSLSRRIGVV